MNCSQQAHTVINSTNCSHGAAPGVPVLAVVVVGCGRGGGRRRRGRRRNIFRAGAPVSLPGPETAVFGC